MTRRSSLSYPKFSARKSMSSGVARWSYNSLYSLSFIEKAHRSARSGITERQVSLKGCGLGAPKRGAPREAEKVEAALWGSRRDARPRLPPEARRATRRPAPRPGSGPATLRGGGPRAHEGAEGREGP